MKFPGAATNSPGMIQKEMSQMDKTIIKQNPSVRILGRPAVRTVQAPAVTPRAVISRMVTSSLYMVDSSTATLVAYKVTADRFGHWSCNCMAAYYNRLCKHLTSVLAEEAVREAPEIAEDLATIADYIAEGGPVPPITFHCDAVRDAQSSWSYDDGEVA